MRAGDHLPTRLHHKRRDSPDAAGATTAADETAIHQQQARPAAAASSRSSKGTAGQPPERKVDEAATIDGRSWGEPRLAAAPGPGRARCFSEGLGGACQDSAGRRASRRETGLVFGLVASERGSPGKGKASGEGRFCQSIDRTGPPCCSLFSLWVFSGQAASLRMAACLLGWPDGSRCERRRL